MTEDNQKIATIKDIIPERKPDSRLWTDVRRLSEGDAQDRIEAVDLIFEKNYSLPDETNQLLKRLAGKTESPSVRRRIAKLLQQKPNIPFGVYSDLLDILSEDEDPEVRKIVTAIDEELKERMRPIIELSKTTQEHFLRIAEAWRQLSFPYTMIRESLQQFQQINSLISSNYFDTIRLVTQNNDILMKTLANLRTGFYPSSVLIQRELISEEEEIAHHLIECLEGIPSGPEHWIEYQSLCKEILNFCFVPPLLDPFEEERTDGGLHRRDLIYHIPHGVGGFWDYIKIAYSALAVIVDCKNYSESLRQNEVVITSKYFGSKKLGNFGIMVSRKGLHDSGRKQQLDRWIHHDEMIVCLSDDDLKDMIRLKLEGEDPEIVIDFHIRTLRQSI